MRAGRLRVLAVTSAKRVTLFPEVPTIPESGFPGYEVVQWFGLVLPAGTTRALVEKYNREAVTILSTGDAREALLKQGFEPVGSTPGEFGAHIRSELAKWVRLFKELGLQGSDVR